MSILSRLFGNQPDSREALRPLWNRTIELARAPGWYASLGIKDSTEGRFDMLTLVLALVILKTENEPDMTDAAARLTELFVEDMDGQLRQSGIGDPTVGKHVRKLVTTLGGRLGALREALPLGEQAVIPVLERNMTATEGCDFAKLASAVIALHETITATAPDALISADLPFDPQ